MAEGARLESVYTGNRIVGSNPTLSARIFPRHNGRSGFRISWPPPFRKEREKGGPPAPESSEFLVHAPPISQLVYGIERAYEINV